MESVRLQGLAEPEHRGHCRKHPQDPRHRDEVHDFASRRNKGIPEPVRAGESVRPKSDDSRFEALRTATTPLVCRDEEIEFSMRRWTQAKYGDGVVVRIMVWAGYWQSRIKTQRRIALTRSRILGFAFSACLNIRKARRQKQPIKTLHCVPEFVPSARKGFCYSISACDGVEGLSIVSASSSSIATVCYGPRLMNPSPKFAPRKDLSMH